MRVWVPYEVTAKDDTLEIIRHRRPWGGWCLHRTIKLRGASGKDENLTDDGGGNRYEIHSTCELSVNACEAKSKESPVVYFALSNGMTYR